MEKDKKTNLIISALLVTANAIGLAYFLNPEKFKSKVKDAKEAIKKAVGK